MYLGRLDLDDYLLLSVPIHDSTGAAADADAAPSYAVYEHESAPALLTGNLAKFNAITGYYTELVQLTAAAGFEIGKAYHVRTEALVGGLTAHRADMFQVGLKQTARDAMKLAPTAGAPAAGSVDEHLDDILTDTGTTLPAAIAGVPAAVDAQLSGTHGAGAWGAGTGATATIYTVTVGGLPEAGVYCRMTTDAAGLVNVDAGTTNSLGQITFHHNVPSGTTVYIWRSKDGLEFSPEPDQEVIP